MSTNWNKAIPASVEPVNLFPDEAVKNWTALEDALSREHIFPGDEGVSAGIHKVPVDTSPPTGYEGRLAIVNDILRFYSNGVWRYGSIPSGTKMLFAQAAAPTGWTQDTSVNDRVLRVVSGSGGGTGGSWTLSGLTVDGHALTIAEMPAHTHTMLVEQVFVNGADRHAVRGPGTGTATSSTGGGQAHSHGLSADGNWRPAYLDVIIATKD
ncbi:MAG: hypothetical protein PHZ19_09385 [Candidatus Thermoplasmatota archaeon]|nr:hypothetical protein [Candidatus Thermoplasmatota archaeon]